jgi:hypothetical protein
VIEDRLHDQAADHGAADVDRHRLEADSVPRLLELDRKRGLGRAFADSNLRSRQETDKPYQIEKQRLSGGISTERLREHRVNLQKEGRQKTAETAELSGTMVAPEEAKKPPNSKIRQKAAKNRRSYPENSKSVRYNQPD